jgi:hypothetical protein
MRARLAAAAGFFPFRFRRQAVACGGNVHAPVRRLEIHGAGEPLPVAQVVAERQRAVPRHEDGRKVRLAGGDGERAVGVGDLAIGRIQIHQFLRRSFRVAHRAIEIRDDVRHFARAVGVDEVRFIQFHQAVRQRPLQRARQFFVGEFEPADVEFAHRHRVHRQLVRPAFVGIEIRIAVAHREAPAGDARQRRRRKGRRRAQRRKFVGPERGAFDGRGARRSRQVLRAGPAGAADDPRRRPNETPPCRGQA